MLTSPLHNAQWTCWKHPTLNAYQITVRWVAGGVRLDYNYLMREDEGPMFWNVVAMMARRIGEQAGVYQDAETKRMQEYAWWRRNSSMYA